VAILVCITCARLLLMPTQATKSISSASKSSHQIATSLCSANWLPRFCCFCCSSIET